MKKQKEETNETIDGIPMKYRQILSKVVLLLLIIATISFLIGLVIYSNDNIFENEILTINKIPIFFVGEIQLTYTGVLILLILFCWFLSNKMFEVWDYAESIDKKWFDAKREKILNFFKKLDWRKNKNGKK